MKIRILCALTVFALFLSVLIACADNAGITEPISADNAEIADNAETDRSQTRDSLPEGLDFDSAAYRILVRDDQFLSEFYAEEASGDIVEDTI